MFVREKRIGAYTYIYLVESGENTVWGLTPY